MNGGTLDRTLPAAFDLLISATISIVAAAQTMITPHPGNLSSQSEFFSTLFSINP
ncbi:MAG: hypothetical protein R3E38_11800 [Nitrosomonas sp.]|nr:hypothetical protein [Nitrosomonas sp.]